MRQRRIPLNVSIIGYARENYSCEQFQKLIYRNIYNVTHPQADRLQFLGKAYIYTVIYIYLYASLYNAFFF